MVDWTIIVAEIIKKNSNINKQNVNLKFRIVDIEFILHCGMLVFAEKHYCIDVHALMLLSEV